MTDTLVVVLDDSVAGTVTRVAHGRLRFDYDDAYRNRPSATPLSVSMPVEVGSHPDHVITPWLWNLLPDNPAVIDRWAREFHVSRSSPFSLLSTPIGEDCPGAVRFAPPDRLDQILRRGGDVTWLTDDEVAGRIRDLREDSTAWLGKSFTGQFSLAGAQAKTALLYDNGRWGVPSGATPTTHILKPAVMGFDDHDLNEHLCLDAARRAGLLAARTRVSRFANESAIVVDRYDRQIRGDTITRVHQEDTCQALGIPPWKKYQNEGGPGPRDIADLLRQVLSPRVVNGSVQRFADALIWNWIIAGTDAHAKNYSLLISGSQVRLAPLYDVASALPYDMHEKKLRLAMKIGGDYRVYPYKNPWPLAARELGLDEEALRLRVQELLMVAPQAFADSAKTPDVLTLDRPLPVKLVDLVAERAHRCLSVLGAQSTAS
jgi:serine/threonine-protein kinase HipA